jgi:Raf kinase inhibitor-like YbhB/YbcL family protein
MIESLDFNNGERIPIEEVCLQKKGGMNVNPGLKWSVDNKNIKSFVLILEDLDAIKVVGHPYIHWFIPYISPQINSILSKENKGSSAAIVHKDNSGNTTMIEGENNSGDFGYFGPCPPKGQKHRYDYHLYGINSLFKPQKAVYTTNEFENEMGKNILSHDLISGYYIDT